MSAKHTPGPWIYAIPGDSFVASDNGLICRRPAVSGGGSAPSNWDANARLIAAAPELLDALQQWAHAVAIGDEVELINASAARDAAITKAIG